MPWWREVEELEEAYRREQDENFAHLDEIERLRIGLNRARMAFLSIENRTATPAFVTTQIDLIDAALRGPEKP